MVSVASYMYMYLYIYMYMHILCVRSKLHVTYMYTYDIVSLLIMHCAYTCIFIHIQDCHQVSWDVLARLVLGYGMGGGVWVWGWG